MANEKRGVIVYDAEGRHVYPTAVRWEAPATGELLVYTADNELLVKYPKGGWDLDRVTYADEEAEEGLSGLGFMGDSPADLF
jgi:hypothetical protein